MKNIFILSAFILGFSLSGMSQSTYKYEQLTVIAGDSLPGNASVYRLKSHQTGYIYESLPISAQLYIGEVIIARHISTGVVNTSDEVSIIGMGAEGKKTIVENERTGLLFLRKSSAIKADGNQPLK